MDKFAPGYAQKTTVLNWSLIQKASFWRSGSEADQASFFAFATALVAFCIPLMRKGLTLPIFVLVLAWLLAPKPYFRRNVWPILIFSGLYFFHLIAILYTENMAKGSADLMQKLSLLLFPVIYGSTRALGSNQAKTVLSSFVLGTLAAVVLALATASSAYHQSGDYMEYYMSRFSPVHHPTYIAMYINFAAFILLFRIHRNYYTGLRLGLVWALLLGLSLVLIFPASKAGFINFALLLLVYTALFFSAKPYKFKVAFGVGLVAFGFFALLRFNPVAQGRMSRTVDVAQSTDLVAPANEMESNTARLIAWKMGLREIPKHPFGVGTGDIGDFLRAGFRADGYDLLADADLNLHNTYLQIALAQGILAALFFMFSLAYPFRFIWAQRDWIYGFFLLSIAMQFLVECMLETQGGVIYFAFFNAVLFFKLKNESGHE